MSEVPLYALSLTLSRQIGSLSTRPKPSSVSLLALSRCCPLRPAPSAADVCASVFKPIPPQSFLKLMPLWCVSSCLWKYTNSLPRFTSPPPFGTSLPHSGTSLASPSPAAKWTGPKAGPFQGRQATEVSAAGGGQRRLPPDPPGIVST